GLVSSGALFDHGGVATLGRMMVRPPHQGQGLGRAILQALLAARTGGAVLLSATPQGARLYRRAGFREVGCVHKIVAPAPLAGLFAVEASWRLEGLAALDEALALDAAAFGGDRRRVLAGRATAVVGVRAAGALLGYGMAVARGGATQIGPVIASGAGVAGLIVAALCHGRPGPFRLDVPGDQRPLLEALRARGAHDPEPRP